MLTPITNYIVGKILEIFRFIITGTFPEKYEIFWETFPAPHHYALKWHVAISFSVWVGATVPQSSLSDIPLQVLVHDFAVSLTPDPLGGAEVDPE